jgi:hypothetical protein
MQIDIAALFEGQTRHPTEQQTQTRSNHKVIAPIPTTNLIDLTDLEIVASEDHPMTLETDQPTSSGQIGT